MRDMDEWLTNHNVYFHRSLLLSFNLATIKQSLGFSLHYQIFDPAHEALCHVSFYPSI